MTTPTRIVPFSDSLPAGTKPAFVPKASFRLGSPARAELASGAAGVKRRYYIPLFSPHEFIWRRPLEKFNPWLHHLDRYGEALV